MVEAVVVVEELELEEGRGERRRAAWRGMREATDTRMRAEVVVAVAVAVEVEGFTGTASDRHVATTSFCWKRSVWRGQNLNCGCLRSMRGWVCIFSPSLSLLSLSLSLSLSLCVCVCVCVCVCLGRNMPRRCVWRG